MAELAKLIGQVPMPHPIATFLGATAEFTEGTTERAFRESVFLGVRDDLR